MSTTPTPESDEVFGSRVTGVRSRKCRDLERRLAAMTAERDALAAKFTRLDRPKHSGDPMLDSVLTTRNPAFDEWVASLPTTYWVRYDLCAARIGFEAAIESAIRKHLTLLKEALSHLVYVQDEGPLGEGWKSEGLHTLIAEIEEITQTQP